MVIPVSGGLEAKLQDMTDEEKDKYCEEAKTQRYTHGQIKHAMNTFYDIANSYLNNCACVYCSVLTKIIKTGYAALQLEYFFTAGPDEVRAWTVRVRDTPFGYLSLPQ